MIYFPADLTPLPYCPGYFWDVEEHKLFSIKVGGVLRELKMLRAHPAMFTSGRFTYSKGGLRVGDPYYRVSVNGRYRYLTFSSLKKLELVHYDMPVIRRVENENS